MGLRFDFKNKLITETGGIYVKSIPQNVELTLDGEPVKNEAGILSAGTFIDNLAPGTHHLVLNLEGYSGWQKNTPVEPGSVSVFDYVVLVPNESRKMLFDRVDSFAFANGLFVTENEGKIEFDDTRIIGNEIVHFTDEGTVITRNSLNDTYYSSDIFDLGSSLNLNVIFNNLKETRLNLPGAVPVRKISPYPSDDSRFIVLTGRAIYSMDTDGLSVEQIDSSANDFSISGNQLFWINESGISSINLLFDTEGIVFEDSPTNIKQFDSNSSGDSLFVLSGNGTLVYVDLEQTTSTILSTSADEFSVSPSGSLILFSEKDGGIKIYDLDWEEGDRGKKLLELISVDSGINKVSWYQTDSYIFIKDNSGNLRFVEIDEHSPINEVVISDQVGDFLYDDEAESLYYGNAKGVWSLEL